MTFDPNEARDQDGKWSPSGAVSDPNAVARPKGWEIWGASHDGSSQITGSAAKIMGIDGYRLLTSYTKTPSSSAARLATAFLDEIRDSKGSAEPLYHGFQNVKNVAWQPGDTFKVPLLATSGDIDTSASYGAGGSPPTIFEFPQGTKMAGYSKAAEPDAKENGHIWNEALVAGEFKVVGTRVAKTASWARVTVVRLEPKAVFDPDKKKWVN